MRFVGFLFFRHMVNPISRPVIAVYVRLARRNGLASWSRFKRQRWAQFLIQTPDMKEYTKPYRSPQELLEKLIGQGLVVSDRHTATTFILQNNYFRIKGYFVPFFGPQQKFFPGTSFSDIHNLYQADQKIRDFLFPLIAVLEVRGRAVLDNVITAATGDPFWHLDSGNFRSFAVIKQVLNKAGKRFHEGRQEFAAHYRETYYTRKSFAFRRIPPFWIISEIFTLEQFVTFLKQIDRDQFRRTGKNLLDDCAQQFGLNGFDALFTNFQCLLELRNICAHHTRLWNRNLQAPNGIVKKLGIKNGPEIKPNRLYLHLAMLRVMCKKQGIADGIKEFFVPILASHSIFSRDMGSMGFPPNWETDPIWA